MDASNLASIRQAAEYWKSKGMGEFPSLEALKADKIRLMTRYAKGKFQGAEEVPDPYYGGEAGFELVLDLLEDSCEGLLDDILAKRA